MKKKPALTFYTFVLVCFAFLISTEKSVAQEQGIFELSNDDVSSKVKTKVNKKNRDHFYNLAQKLHATAYISNNTVNNVYGKDEIKKINFKDAKSFSLLDKKKFDKAELIIIKVNKYSDLNNTLDLTSNEKPSSLKYVFVKCNFKCTEQQIKKFVKVKPNSGIRIFYKTELPS